MSKSEISDDQMIEREFDYAVSIIKKEIPFVDKREYSHNIISLLLGSIAEKSGDDKANQVIKDLNLEKLGWKLMDHKKIKS